MISRSFLLPDRLVVPFMLSIIVFYSSGFVGKSAINNQPHVRFGLCDAIRPTHFSRAKPVVSAMHSERVRAILMKKENFHEQKRIGRTF